MPLSIRLVGSGADLAQTTIELLTTSPRQPRRDVPVEMVRADLGGAFYLRGDVDLNGAIEITDAIAGLQGLFLSRPLGCVLALDANGDGGTDITDPIYLLRHLFLGGPPPPAPYPECDRDADPPPALSCDVEACRPE